MSSTSECTSRQRHEPADGEGREGWATTRVAVAKALGAGLARIIIGLYNTIIAEEDAGRYGNEDEPIQSFRLCVAWGVKLDLQPVVQNA